MVLGLKLDSSKVKRPHSTCAYLAEPRGKQKKRALSPFLWVGLTSEEGGIQTRYLELGLTALKSR
jgi:hypothetical protein